MVCLTDTAPIVTLVLTPDSISESGSSNSSTVTATLKQAVDTAFTVTVSADAVSPAVAGDFELSANKVLTFAANATRSTGTVTITLTLGGEATETDDYTVSSKSLTLGATQTEVTATVTAVDDSIIKDEAP